MSARLGIRDRRLVDQRAIRDMSAHIGRQVEDDGVEPSREPVSVRGFERRDPSWGLPGALELLLRAELLTPVQAEHLGELLCRSKLRRRVYVALQQRHKVDREELVQRGTCRV
jgi:hypothetical protein